MLRKVDGEIPEDHLIIISDDTTHDDPFVELANKDITISLTMDALSNTIPKL